MSAFELILNPVSLERREGRPTVGAVHVVIDGHAFPEEGWTDFALEFLEAYWQAILNLRTKEESSVSFYEGPYALKFLRTDKGVEVQALDRDVIKYRETLEYVDLLEHTMQAILPWISHEQAINA